MSSGCAAPPDPPATETAGPALEKAGIIEDVSRKQVKTPSEKKLTPEQKAAAEEAQMERKIRAMAHYAAAIAHRERGEDQEALDEFYKAALANPSDQKIMMEVVQLQLHQDR